MTRYEKTVVLLLRVSGLLLMTGVIARADTGIVIPVRILDPFIVGGPCALWDERAVWRASATTIIARPAVFVTT